MVTSEIPGIREVHCLDTQGESRVPKAIQFAHEGDISPPLRRLGQSVLLSTDEIEFFESMQNNLSSYEKGEAMVAEGDEYRCCFAIRSGWAISYRMTMSGRRQILSVHLPGDFIGLHINFHRRAVYTVAALTKVEVALIEPIRLVEIHQRWPVLAAGLDWSAVRASNILSEHNVSLGARTAQERILHFYLELWCRLMLVGEASSEGFQMRMTQEQVGNALGLSVVHVNKSLKALTKQGLLDITGRMIDMPDVAAAIRMADFDASFLDSFRLANDSSLRQGSTRDLLETIDQLTDEMTERRRENAAVQG